MELKDTVDLMNSEDYNDRFKAEYFQTKIRYNKLYKMLIKKAVRVRSTLSRLALLRCSPSRSAIWASISEFSRLVLRLRASLSRVIEGAG